MKLLPKNVAQLFSTVRVSLFAQIDEVLAPPLKAENLHILLLNNNINKSKCRIYIVDLHFRPSFHEDNEWSYRMQTLPITLQRVLLFVQIA